jgi:hypothetical protein
MMYSSINEKEYEYADLKDSEIPDGGVDAYPVDLKRSEGGT